MASNIQDIHHQPSMNITSEDDVTIHVTLESKDNISIVEYQYCEIDPQGICTIYSDMTPGEGNNYTGVIPDNNAGATIGYKVRIEYDNGSEEYSPSKDSYHEYYIEKDPEDDDDDSPFIPAPLFVIAILMATLMIRKRK